MPRVTAAHRRARRDEIADAALRVLERRGVSNTSIAQIVAESGLSAGAIYANFENKAELARYIAESLLQWRFDVIAEQVDGPVRRPLEVLSLLLGTMDSDAPPLSVVVQFWGEAAVDPELHAVLVEQLSELRRALRRAVRPWADSRTADGTAAAALAERTATALLITAQGYLANTGLLGWTTAEDYVAALGSIE